MRWRSMAASTRDGMAAHAQGSLSLSPWRRCIGAAASALHGGNQGLREGARVEGEGRVGRLEGWAGWAGPCESARAIGGVLLLLRVLRHRRWSASSTVAYAVAALCARARARECASVLRQACVCPRLAAMFKTKCARERASCRVCFCSLIVVITSPLFTFLLGANPSASELRRISRLTELSETERYVQDPALPVTCKRIPCRAGPKRGRSGAASVAPACLLHDTPHTERAPCVGGQAADVTETPDPTRERKDQPKQKSEERRKKE